MQNYRELVNQVVGKEEHVDKPKEICFFFFFLAMLVYQIVA